MSQPVPSWTALAQRVYWLVWEATRSWRRARRRRLATKRRAKRVRQANPIRELMRPVEQLGQFSNGRQLEAARYRAEALLASRASESMWTNPYLTTNASQAQPDPEIQEWHRQMTARNIQIAQQAHEAQNHPISLAGLQNDPATESKG